MSIRLHKTRDDITLFTTSELTRKLDVPSSRMKTAISEGIVRPIGTIAHAAIVALTDDELESLRAKLHPPAART